MKRSWPFVVAALFVTLGLAVFVSPFAASDPDGLERVARKKGFASTERAHSLRDSPVADYSVEGVAEVRIATALSGLIGVLLAFGMGAGLLALVRTRRKRGGPPGGPAAPAPRSGGSD
jgi:PDGLE domain